MNAASGKRPRTGLTSTLTPGILDVFRARRAALHLKRRAPYG